MTSTKELNSIEFQNILHKYQKSLECLKDWGINISEDSRLLSYEKSIKYLADKGIGKDPSHLCNLMFDLIEIDEINDIVLNENNISTDSEITIKINDMLKGLRIKNIDEDPQARSSQFELYIRTLLNVSGLDCNFKPTESTKTPDLMIAFNDINFDLEVKRPLSANNLHRNTFKKACSQLNDNNPGMMVLSLDHVLLGNHNVIQLEKGDSLNDCIKLLEDETTKWLNENKKKLMKRFKSVKSVCAILIIVKVPIFVGRLDKILFANHMRQVNLQGVSKDNSISLDSISSHLDKVWGKD